MQKSVRQLAALAILLSSAFRLCAADDISAYFTDGWYAGGGAACYVAGAVGGAPAQVAAQTNANNNAVTGGVCWGACRNPSTLTHVDPLNLTFTLQSNCTGENYTFLITAIPNPKKSCPITGGNPCNLATGDKVQTEIDYVDPSGGGLDFRREYSSNAPPMYVGTLGRNWQSNFERHATRFTGTVASATVQGVEIQFTRSNGQVLTFRYDQVLTRWLSDPDVKEVLEQTTDVNGVHAGWRLYPVAGNSYELYDSAGRYVAFVESSGRAQSFIYGPDEKLIEVRNDNGRKLLFEYSGGKLSKLTTPEGSAIEYAYNAAGLLQKVTYPDSTPGDPSDNPFRTYLYESPFGSWLLTGIVDEANDRFASWAYDAQRRATLSVHGPASGLIDRVTFAYNGFDNNSDGLAGWQQHAYFRA